jgi:hypothetical protein
MSIININNNFGISYGYGDYYNVIMQIPKQELINSTKYHVSEFSIKDYNFNIINTLSYDI